MNISRDQWNWWFLGFGLGMVVGAVITCAAIKMIHQQSVTAAIDVIINLFVAIGTIAAACFAAFGFLRMQQEKEPIFDLELETVPPSLIKTRIKIKNLNHHPVIVKNVQLHLSHQDATKSELLGIKAPMRPVKLHDQSNPYVFTLEHSYINEKRKEFLRKTFGQSKAIIASTIKEVDACLAITTHGGKLHYLKLDGGSIYLDQFLRGLMSPVVTCVD